MEAQIYKTVAQVMQEINAISKGRKNAQQGFNFRGIDDVMNELHPVMAKCGLFVVPEVLEENRTEGKTKSGGSMFYTRLKIKFTFYAGDGSNVAAVVIGEAMDTGDKASNKALSIGLKYAMLQVFCIPTEDDKDPDATSHTFDSMTPAAKQERNQAKKQAPAAEGPAGGPDTDKEHKEINSILALEYEDGQKIFDNKDCQKIGQMRMTMTAREVIVWLRDEVGRRGQKYAEDKAPAAPEAVTTAQEEALDSIF